MAHYGATSPDGNVETPPNIRKQMMLLSEEDDKIIKKTIEGFDVCQVTASESR